MLGPRPSDGSKGALSGEGACFIEVLSSSLQIVAIPAANWLKDSPALALAGQSPRPYVAGWKEESI